jgi:hypothetical protein
LTRFAISVSHPSAASPAVLYAGFDWVDGDGHHPSRVFKSTNGGDSWTILPGGSQPDKVADYCATQCSYDNVIEADPTNPNVVFAAGQFDYGIGSGGIYRSDDGGQTWKNLGWDQHPDFHAIAFNAANTAQVLIGNDGGVWSSNSRGGRPNASDPLQAVTWVDLNGTVNPSTAGIVARSNLSIAQFTSIATVPQARCSAESGPARVASGAERRTTARCARREAPRSTGSTSRAATAGRSSSTRRRRAARSLRPATSTGRTTASRRTGTRTAATSSRTSTSERARPERPLGLLHAVRAEPEQSEPALPRHVPALPHDNAKAPAAGDVHWKAISDDLTTGCTGAARTARGTARSPRSASAAARPCTRARWTASSTCRPTLR